MKVCEACFTPANVDLHHIKTKKAYPELKDDEKNHLYLCRNDHRLVHHHGLNHFIKDYPHIERVLKDRGWRKDGFNGKWFLPKV